MGRIFISYSTVDYQLALQVAHGLESEGLPCFVAKRDLELGLNWIEGVARNLKEAPAVVFLATANSVQSHECQNELREANKRRTPVIPVVVEAAALTDELSLQVGSRQYLDASGHISEWGPRLAAGLRIHLSSGAGATPTASAQSGPNAVAAHPSPMGLRELIAPSTGRKSKPQLYLDFWTLYLKRLHEEHPDWSRANTPSSKNWMFLGSPFKGAFYRTIFRSRARLGHDLYIDAGDEAKNSAMYAELLAARDLFEEAYGSSLTWSDMPGMQACCISDDTAGSVDQVDRHEEQVRWLLDRGDRMRSAVAAFERARGGPRPGGHF